MKKVMKHHGERLRSLLKSKGYDIQRLANQLTVTRVAVEKDLKREELSRRALSKYIGVLFESFEEFYESENKGVEKVNHNTNVSYDAYSELQAKYIDLQARFIELQDRHLELTTRFFPNAVQRVPITA